ncbi:hypothetical protein QVD17_01869 [Tagetes erecta]|uniref:Uncharacterized protein n=1 Tax=Tagetes erecta TaxID=13708 RepID=A0AAD8L5L7_TARER|nr:hypothetical protein QVD17_01869 [Tagetes erecta]
MTVLRSLIYLWALRSYGPNYNVVSDRPKAISHHVTSLVYVYQLTQCTFISLKPLIHPPSFFATNPNKSPITNNN